MNAKSKKSFGLLVAGLFLMSAFAFSCAQLQEDKLYILTGKVLDISGKPIQGALVSAGGITAEFRTDKNGNFQVISPYPFGEDIVVTAYSDGFEPFVDKFEANTGKEDRINIPEIRMAPADPPSYVRIITPHKGSPVSVNENCNAKMKVRGVVSYPPRPNLRMDVVFVIDASGSTEKEAGEGESIYSTEIQAAKKLMDELTRHTTRIGIVRFAASASIEQDLTEDIDTAKETLDAMYAAGPEPLGESGSGTNYEAALHKALDAFTPLIVTNSDTGEEEEIPTLKIVVFMSDGIPTLPYYSGMTQEREDVTASLNAAFELRERHIAVHGYAVGISASRRHLTTLPAICTITRGKYYVVDEPQDVAIILPESNLVGMGDVEITNMLTNDTVSVTPSPDGFFEVELPVVVGRQVIQAVAYDYSGSTFASDDVWIEGVAYSGDSPDTPQGLADEPVSERGLFTPYGEPLHDDDLKRVLIGQYNNYPDAIEALNTEILYVPGDPSEDVTVQGAMILKQACFKSDVGYLVIDPDNILESTLNAFYSATDANVLFHSGEIWPRCAYKYLPPGYVNADYSFTVKGGSYVVFFMVPNGTLKKGQSGKRAPLFTVSAANPGGMDQVLTYYSEAGRLGENGPQTVFAFEDLYLINGSDKDYSDVVFYTQVIPSLSPPVCE